MFEKNLPVTSINACYSVCALLMTNGSWDICQNTHIRKHPLNCQVSMSMSRWFVGYRQASQDLSSQCKAEMSKMPPGLADSCDCAEISRIVLSATAKIVVYCPWIKVISKTPVKPLKLMAELIDNCDSRRCDTAEQLKTFPTVGKRNCGVKEESQQKSVCTSSRCP